MKLRVLGSLLIPLAMIPATVVANTYPTKSIRVIVPFPPGGTTDIVARALSDKMSEDLGVTVIIENKPGGAGGSVGTMEIVRAVPDGYTVGIATVGTIGTAPATAPNALYHPAKDFSYISNIATMPMLIAAGPSLKQESLNEVIEQAKKEPNKLTYASSGTGGVAHLMGVSFEVATGTEFTHIPYRGASPAITDVAGGRVDLLFDALASSFSFLKNGHIRALAVSGNERVASLPDVPTFAEVGFPEVSTNAWYGLIGPANMDPSIVDRLNAAVISALATSDVRERLERLDTQAVGNSPAEYRKQAIEEFEGWRKLAESQQITVD